MSQRRPLTHWLLLLSLVVMWGSSFMFTKIAVAALSPSVVVAGRVALGAAVMAGLFVLTRRRVPTRARLWLFLALIALVGNCVPFWLISWGQRGIDSGVAGILMAIMPLTTVVLAHFFVAGERLNMAKAAGFLLGFSGIVVLMGPDLLLELEGSGTALLSQLAVLGGAFCYAVNTIISRHRPKSDALVSAAGVTLIAALVMVPVAGPRAPAELADAPLAALAALGFLGLVSTATATVVYFTLITAAGPSFLSLINYLIPLWALVMGVVFLGETPKWTALAGLVLVLSGIALSETRGRRLSAARGGAAPVARGRAAETGGNPKEAP